MNKDTITDLAGILLDIADVRASRGHARDSRALIELASAVAGGQLTVFDKLQRTSLVITDAAQRKLKSRELERKN